MPRRRSFVVSLAAAVLVVAASLPAHALAGPGSPDPAFSGGYVTATFPGSSAFYGVAMSGKKIVAAGYAHPSSKDMAAARFLPSGALDTTFSGDGQTTVHFTSSGSEADDVIAMPDGRTLLVGSTDTASGGGKFALAMLKPGGALDPSFGGDGKVTTGFPNFGAYAYTAVLLPNGKIVAGGELYRSSDSKGNFAMARYLPNGKLDTTFGDHGRVVTNVERSDDGIWAMALQSDGKIVASGWSSASSGVYHTAVARYMPSGKLDTTFSGDGMLVFNAMHGTSNYSLGEAFGRNGRIIVGIHVDSQPAEVLQLTASGKKDVSFGGGDGVASTSGTFALQGLALQSDGKIVVSGTTASGVSVFRMNGNGTPDGSFGSGGLGALGVPSNGNRLVIDGKGRAVVSGDMSSEAIVTRFLG